MSTPILPFAVWESGTNQNSVPANDNSLRNQILNGLVISDSTDAQPSLVSPADDGSIYIMTGAATGAQWSTFDEFDLAIFMGGAWYAFAPVEGVVVNLAGALVAWDGASYAVVGGGGSFTGGSLTSALNEAKGSDIASAATTDIGAATGNLVHITGTTTITSLGTVQAGTERIVVFDGILILTHNGTSLILPTGANITTAANDVAIFRSEGSGNWRCVAYQRASGSPLAGGGGGLTNWTEAVNSSSPNATIPVVSFVATNAATNVDVALKAKGNGSVSAQVADSTTAGGNKRGRRATDWQASRTNSANVASGDDSTIGGGTDNIANNQSATVAGGGSNQAINTGATVGGGVY